MPAASTSRQPGNTLAWFDGAEGSTILQDEIGLLQPLLGRCPGERACHILPTERAARHAPPLRRVEQQRIWCDEAGWHGDFGHHAELPPRALHGMDLVIAAHVVGTFPGARERLRVLHRMLALGGTAFFIEFYPWSLYRRRWRGSGLDALSLRRLAALLRETGFQVGPSYALRPRSSLDSTGLLLRHNWRLPSWLPLRAYAIRVRRSEPGITLVGSPAPVFPLEVAN